MDNEKNYFPDFAPHYRILAVDDEDSILTLYRDVLLLEWENPHALESVFASTEPGIAAEIDAKPPLDLATCMHAREAVELVRDSIAERKPFSVALVDIRLDEQPDGVWAAERIRELDPNIEIVMVTAHGDVSLSELNRRIPPPDKLLYLQKPFKPQELRQLANSLCAKWRAENMLVELNNTLLELVEERTAELEQANRQLKRDIQARKQVMERLKASEERYRLLFEEDITGNFVTDGSGTIMDCNESFARIFGFGGVNEAQGLDIFSVEFSGVENEPLLPRIREIGKIESFEASFNRKDGGRVHILGSFEGIFDAYGKLIEVRGYFFDMTERRKLEEQLRIAQKMEALGTLAGGIAHDFGNILGVIMGYAEIISESAPENSGLSRRAGEIVRASRRARDLVDQILNFSRQGTQERKPLKIIPLIKETLKLLRSSLPENISIRQNLMTDDDMVTADPTQMHQILLNLCTNAAQAMHDEGGRLEVSLSDATLDQEAASHHPDLSEGEYLRLTVSDTGPGIEQSVIERIFDPFFTTKKTGEGTGMGLAVVHGIVRHHGGAVLVQSEPGKGTSFNVFLPKTQSLDQTGPQEEPLMVTPEGKVLFVDDEMALMDIGREILESLGFEVTCRTSSIEALEAFRFKPEEFQFVVTDQNMPNMNGVSLSRELLKVRPDIPIILCLGFSENVSYEKLRSLGIKDFIMKPLLKRQLIASINRVMGATQPLPTEDELDQ